MTTPNISQGLGISVISNSGPVLASQLVSISVQADAPLSTPSLVSQLTLIQVVSNNRGALSLDRVITLPCWQPCTAYGTTAQIFYLDGSY